MKKTSRVFLAGSLSLLLSACASQPVASAPADSQRPAEPASPSTSAAAPTVTQAPAQPQVAETVARDSAGFQAWVDAFRRRAAARGVDAGTLSSAFDSAAFQPRIIELDRRQPEFTRAIWEYLDSAVSPLRVSQGREQLATYADIGRSVEAKYGVPRTIIGAIWGVESNYGRNFGNYETIDSLATLGYDGRRSKFAEEQLYAALTILANGDIDRDRMRGSWAGAMGHTQFIPTSFLAYAVDEDGDGRRDIWGSIADVMGSTANYLKRSGWQRGQTWGREVVLPPGFDYGAADMDVRRSSAQWQAQGVRPVDSRGLPAFDSASVIAPAGAHGPAFMVGPNFRVILRYNNATSYALAVGLLSDRLAGEPGVQGDWPRTLASLSRADLKSMQRGLNRIGYGSGTPDGIMGPNTRTGIRAFQRDNGLTPDGYPTYDLLRRIQNAAN
ncbi:lytic murein transglycosylase [Salinisphaera aquimarina]|uniref:Lytic murein transglycosylase n=1 Tax=Salinisphaera aquimarina TaxID=2094031 RepID=A0ABV7EVB8_9GAMM